MRSVILLFIFGLIPIIGRGQTDSWWVWLSNDSYTPKNITEINIEDSSEYTTNLVKSIDIMFDSDTISSNFIKRSMMNSFRNVFFGKWVIDESVHSEENKFHNVFSGKNYKYIYNLFKTIGDYHRKNVGKETIDLYVGKNLIVLYTVINCSDAESECFELICNTDTKFIEVHRSVYKIW